MSNTKVCFKKYFIFLIVISCSFCSSTSFAGITKHLPFDNTADTIINIEAEDYDQGGQGVGYLDTDTINEGNSTYRQGDGVDISTSTLASKTRTVINFRGTEWMRYTFEVATAGYYKIALRAAVANITTSDCEINVDNSFIKTLRLSKTGSFSIFATNTLTDSVFLTAGTHVLKLSQKSSLSSYPDKLVIYSGTLPNQNIAHPSIWVTKEDKAGILYNIANYSWASSFFSQLKTRVDPTVAAHKNNPATYLNTLPKTIPGDRTLMRNTLNMAVESAILYYLTDNKDYAQFSADVLQAYTKIVSVASAVNFYNDYLIESRETYPKLPMIYDFIYPFVSDTTNRIYETATAKYVLYDEAAAQATFTKLADDNLATNLAKNTNQSILEGPGALFNILCIANKEDRDTRINGLLYGTSGHDAFINFSLANFSAESIWPESVSYSKGVHNIVIMMLEILDRYDSTLKIMDKNTRILNGAFLYDDVEYPNKTIIRYGDSNRDAIGNVGTFYSVLKVALRKGYTDIADIARRRLKRANNATGGYNPIALTQTLDWNNPLRLLWASNIDSAVVPYNGPSTTTKITHAGIVVQKNTNVVDTLNNALMGFIGGAHFVHSNLVGIDLEVYGNGYIMGTGGGNAAPDARADTIYTDYYRIFAGHNSVIVNGTSRGSATGSWKADNLLFQNTAVNAAVEPKVGQAPISQNYSFSTQFLNDQINNANQQRTLSLIRTSATSGYYFDLFRSKSNATNNFHDYVYHNLGEGFNIRNLDSTTMALTSTTTAARFPMAAFGGVSFPGWHYFTSPQVSGLSNKGARIRFDLTQSPNAFMHMLLPAGFDRTYTKAFAPPTLSSEGNYPNLNTNVIVVRQNGEAWDRPFISVLEPSVEANSTVKNVENIVVNNVIWGAKITSLVYGETITDYVISKPDSFGTYVNNDIGLSFTGRFGILRIGVNNDARRVSMYIGEGSVMTYDGRTLTADTDRRGLLEYNNGIIIPPPFVPSVVRIEAENYNTGGQGVGYNDQDRTNQGTACSYRTDCADISNNSAASNGYFINQFNGDVSIGTGDWMKYDFTVAKEGFYKISMFASRITAGNVANAAQVNIDSTYFERTLNVVNSGSSNTYAQNDVTDFVYLTAGTHQLRYGSRVGLTHNIDRFLLTQQQVVLPVQLVAFNVIAKKEAVLLSWETAAEVNNSHYILYHAVDGISFNEIAKVAAVNSPYSYQYTHTSAAIGNNFYRLIQVDKDGKLTDLGTRMVKYQSSVAKVFSFYPNPASNQIQLQFKQAAKGDVDVQIIDITGRVVQQQRIAGVNCSNTYSLVLNKSLHAGMYILRVRSNEFDVSERLLIK